MLVNDLHLGQLLEPKPGYKCYFQNSRRSKLLRLRPAQEVLTAIFTQMRIEEGAIMYLGVSKDDESSRNLRTVVVDGQVGYIEGRDFKNFNPVSS